MLEKVALEYVGKVKEFLASRSLSFKYVLSIEVPDKPGVYAIFDEHGRIIYVGKTENLQRRLLKDHRRGGVGGSQFRKALMQNYGFTTREQINSYVDQCTFKFKEIEDPEERVRLEHFAIAILAPTLNMKVKQ
ncbi:MAG: GIY-YIG nuclease family protein [archaeon YNP-LCB-003-016]|uniref:GIY-YIG nuclease family protein n=1 Tax=Candidatus Culexarchaeum yellowstonense TaxID=2928963 RepID=UPI0026F233C1|nr:GIY-YIG nuclease family protein [Candidatus Culexarchaeum yellowstonense]MCR6692999.1 GIY-YIG nuclease family protein [Candidatus Culexarchaeum yellowstonense]